MVAQVVKLSNAIPANVQFVEISRDFSGKRAVYFPDATTASGIPIELVTDIIAATQEQLSAAIEVGKGAKLESKTSQRQCWLKSSRC